jgi:hypothetical protein
MVHLITIFIFTVHDMYMNFNTRDAPYRPNSYYLYIMYTTHKTWLIQIYTILLLKITICENSHLL